MHHTHRGGSTDKRGLILDFRIVHNTRRVVSRTLTMSTLAPRFAIARGVLYSQTFEAKSLLRHDTETSGDIRENSVLIRLVSTFTENALDLFTSDR